jgi:hypothetical protein
MCSFMTSDHPFPSAFRLLTSVSKFDPVLVGWAGVAAAEELGAAEAEALGAAEALGVHVTEASLEDDP